MSESAWLGQGAVAIALVATALYVGAALRLLRRPDPAALSWLRWGLHTSAGALSLAALVLAHAFVTDDFSLTYVFRYSDLHMPWGYKLAAFWSGQAGSLLFWALSLAWMASLVVRAHLREAQAAAVLALVHGLVLLFFIGLMLFISDPFETFLAIDAPADGQGLNPQLQTLAMAIHPPTLLLGYVAATVPLAYAIAALCLDLHSPAWHDALRRWMLGAWIMLTIGLVVGMWWAYTELGWGGYWIWDPVENAGLIPWFVMTAHLHSFRLWERRRILVTWNYALVATAWLLTIFGTFLTRSGFIASIHAFARSEIGDYFMAFMVLAALILIALPLVLRWRRQTRPAPAAPIPLLTQDGMLLLGTFLLLATGAVVLFGTLFPKLWEMWHGSTRALDAVWFNQWVPPLALATQSLTALGLLLGRRLVLRPPLMIAGAVTALLPPLLVWTRWSRIALEPSPTHGLYALGLLFTSALIWSTVGTHGWLDFRAESRRQPHHGLLATLRALWRRHHRRYGAYGIHLGLAAILFGFSGAALKQEERLTLRPDAPAELGGATLVFDGVREFQDPDKWRLYVDLTLHTGSSSQRFTPARYAYRATRMATSEVSLRSTPLMDTYIALLAYEAEDPSVTLLVIHSPLTWWVWLGSIVLVLAALPGLARQRTRREEDPS